jgi:hypothetical protein
MDMRLTLLQESHSLDDNGLLGSKLFTRGCPDQHRRAGFDLRPFIYPSRFPQQFKKIDEVAAVLPDCSNQAADKTKID